MIMTTCRMVWIAPGGEGPNAGAFESLQPTMMKGTTSTARKNTQRRDNMAPLTSRARAGRLDPPARTGAHVHSGRGSAGGNTRRLWARLDGWRVDTAGCLTCGG